MPEYLAPGVFIEEVSYRAKSIEGVSTTTTGFIGPTRYGPVDLEPDVITSLGEFERVYGDREQFAFGNPNDDSKEKIDNYMWHAVRAFFEEGGKRLYISRTFRPVTKFEVDPDDGKEKPVVVSDGYAKAFVPPLKDKNAKPNPDAPWIKVSARFPGELGKMRVWLTLRLGQSVLGKTEIEENGEKKEIPTVGSLLDRDVVFIENVAPRTSPPTSPPIPTESGFYIAQKKRDPATGDILWEFEPLNAAISPSADLKLDSLDVDDGDRIRVVSLTVTTKAVEDPEADTRVYSDLALDSNHKRAGAPDSVFDKFAKEPASIAEARRLPIVIEGNKLKTGSDVLRLLFAENDNLQDNLLNDETTDDDRSISFLLDGGNDGMRPTANEYEGEAKDTESSKTGLKAFEDIEDISIVAAPGSTYGHSDPVYSKQSSTIINLLISHAERMKYRIAVLDSGENQAIAEVRAMRARIDSKYAAFYYPWVRVLDPVTQQEIHLPPSGFVAGIYARNDVERAVYKAPANEVVRLAIGFEKTLNKAQQEVLNPEGVNCFRFFEGRGFRLWGARTTSSDPEWKYVSLRRYFAYLERSIDRGTQWAVFEPNGEALWANVRQTIQDFLYNEWVSGALLGEKPEKAYFVKCDRSTMTQNDLDNGRLVCLVGVAVVKPAEFVIFRIGQWTADRKV
ncbi:MAG TPA: phage tail sheath subtilisin-like domain-containing protein [Pyrinomonadaceae bacterium]|nr:phage tail sheath subtilisin-like domain-containing protein [Pyrinomonadaceae bacterium]